MNKNTIEKNAVKFTVLFLIVAMIFVSFQPIESAYAQIEYDYQGKSGQVVGDKDHNSIKMLDPSDITVLSATDDGFVNQINETLDGNEPIEFKFIMSAGQNQYNETNFINQSMPQIHIYNKNESKIVASYSNGSGKLKYLGGQSNSGKHDGSGWIKVGINSNALDPGDYILYFGPNIGGNNPDKILGVYLKFKFTIEGLALSEALEEVEALTSTDKVIADQGAIISDEAWGKYPESAKDILLTAADTAREVYENQDANEDEQKAAAQTLSDAIDVYKKTRYIKIEGLQISSAKPQTITVGEKGVATATVDSNPDETQYKNVEWTASDNISIDKSTGEWQVNLGGESCITATAITATTNKEEKEVDSWKFDVSQYDSSGMLCVNIPSRMYDIQKMLELTGENLNEIKALKITASGDTTFTTDELKYVKNNLPNLKKLDIKNSKLTVIEPIMFENCTKLETIVLPTGTTTIGMRAFSGCTNLKDITLPPALDSIDEKAFENCTSLSENLKVFAAKPPKLSTSSGKHSFEGSSVKSITVPYICKEDYADSPSWKRFTDITEMPEVKLSVTVDQSGSFERLAKSQMANRGITEEDVNSLIISTSGDARLTRAEDHAYLQNSFIYVTTLDMGGAETQDHKCNAGYFKDRISLKSIILPPDTETIGSSAFSGCVSLKNIKLPSKLTKIGTGAFAGCSSLPEAIVIDAVNPPEYDGSPFSPDVVKSFIVPVKSVDTYKKTVGWASFNIEPQIKIALDTTNLVMLATEARTIRATVSTFSDNDDRLEWSSSHKRIATVDKNGKVTAIRPGTVDIIATTVEGGIQAICKVTVKAINAPITKVTSANYNSIKLTWNRMSDVTGYEIFRATSKNGVYAKVRTLGSSAGTYTDTGLNTGSLYYYKVRAYRDVNNTRYSSDYSSVISAKPTLKKASVTKVKAQKGRKAKISWKKVPGANGYVIYRSAKKNKGFKKIKTVKAKTTKFTNKKLKKGKKYFYKVRAYRNVSGKKIYGGYSKTISCKIKK